MRVNIYSQEQTSEVDLVEKEGAEGQKYSAIFFPIASSNALHDDDESGVTFWLPKSPERRKALSAMFERAARLCLSADEE